ncbi:alcohol dehydrogenase [Flaviflexus salsibiostraticola]|uniref:Alcohol dehydrogenase n=1 Tax=Flaviflexus salsibiostraticola TaxID=1282737 RepID=A0A3S8ZAV8_9ACTO|nr:alcohol dehydrogenase catalytic domain-containing protein [Flaviflexus salsibiostraticola]AZN30602.1 alcohol dehydrogenase [Flaviflexus salsibiostraticola]
MKIRGAVLEEMGRERPYERSEPLAIVELDLTGPGATELLVRMDAAGVCHSDLSVVEGNRPRPVPMLLGHEACGTVVEIGSDVTGFSIGDQVVMSFLPRCGECKACQTDGKLPCSVGSKANNDGVMMSGEIALERNGEKVYHHLGVSAFATHAVVDYRSAVVVDREVPPEIAAVLGCAVLTGGGAVLNAAKPSPEDTVMVVGLGGVGMAALITALAQDVQEVIAVDALQSKLERAKELGAHRVYTPQEVAEQGITADRVIEAAGHVKAFETAYNAMGFGGMLVTVGLPPAHAKSEIAPLNLTAAARTVVGSYLGSAVPSRDIPEYAKLYLEGKLPVAELISSIIRFEDINMAMDELADGNAVRQVILFDSEGE